MATTTSSQPDSPHLSTSEEPIPLASGSDRSTVAEDSTSSTSDPRGSTVSPPKPGKAPRRKQPMRDFKWGWSQPSCTQHSSHPIHAMIQGNLIRKTLPVRTIPRWLDPGHVDVADPRKLPLCWYGVPFVRKLVYPYAERMGLASYYTEELLSAKPGDLDTFQTWANFDVWFKKVSGLQLDLNLVWGEPTPILTFFSNHEVRRVTKDQLELILDLLDDMDYGEEYQLMWYLDRNLDY